LGLSVGASQAGYEYPFFADTSLEKTAW